MTYLLDRKAKRKKYLILFLIGVVLFFLVYFRSAIFSGLSKAAVYVFNPFISLGQGTGEYFSGLSVSFSSKSSLASENELLRSELDNMRARTENYNTLVEDNMSLREILGRSGERRNLVVAAILAKPVQSIYDTLLIDAGSRQGIKEGDIVFALGDIPVGRISDVYTSSSKVVLFSGSGERTEVSIGGVYFDAVGRGGGNFKIETPRDFFLSEGEEATLPGINSYILARVESIISDPRDAFLEALLVSPVNLEEIKFVQVEI